MKSPSLVSSISKAFDSTYKNRDEYINIEITTETEIQKQNRSL